MSSPCVLPVLVTLGTAPGIPPRLTRSTADVGLALTEASSPTRPPVEIVVTEGQQEKLGVRCVSSSLTQHLDARHVWHPLIRRGKGARSNLQRKLGQCGEAARLSGDHTDRRRSIRTWGRRRPSLSGVFAGPLTINYLRTWGSARRRARGRCGVDRTAEVWSSSALGARAQVVEQLGERRRCQTDAGVGCPVVQP